MERKRVRLTVIGVGNRARKYLHESTVNPSGSAVTCLVEPDPVRLASAQNEYGVPAGSCYSNADDFFAAGRDDVDAVMICSPDLDHYDQCMKAIEAGYDILLEKPVGITPEECRSISDAATRKGVKVQVCYVLRFHPLYRKVREIISSGALGKVISIDYTNFVGLDRALHTYVRGLWSRRETCHSVILAKCCHDLDFIFWATGSHAKKVSSTSSRLWFREENAPEGSAARCCDCPLDATCAYSAPDMYLRRGVWISNFPVRDGETLKEALEREMREGPYGRCVFRCDNDVEDNGSLLMQMEDGSKATLSIDLFTRRDGRRATFQMSGGEIELEFDRLKAYSFDGKFKLEMDCNGLISQPYHGGLDLELFRNFLAACRGEEPLEAPVQECIESHLVCF